MGQTILRYFWQQHIMVSLLPLRSLHTSPSMPQSNPRSSPICARHSSSVPPAHRQSPSISSALLWASMNRYGIKPLSINGPQNNDKKMKWLVEPIGMLILHDVLLEEEREAHLMRFSSIRLWSQKSVYRQSLSLFWGPLVLKSLLQHVENGSTHHKCRSLEKRKRALQGNEKEWFPTQLLGYLSEGSSHSTASVARTVCLRFLLQFCYPRRILRAIPC